MPSLARPANDLPHVLHHNKTIGPGYARQLWANMPEHDGCVVGVDEYRRVVSALCCAVTGDPCIRQHSGACKACTPPHSAGTFMYYAYKVHLLLAELQNNICTCVYICLDTDFASTQEVVFSASALQRLKGRDTTSVHLIATHKVTLQRAEL